MAEKRKRPAKKSTAKKNLVKKAAKKTSKKTEQPKNPVFEIKKSHHRHELTRLQQIFAGLCVAMVALFGLSLSDNIYALSHWQKDSTSDVITHIKSLGTQYQLVKQDALTLEQGQNQSGIVIQPNTAINERLAEIRTEIETQHKPSARRMLLALSQDVARWQTQLNARNNASMITSGAGSLQVPILLYHYTPTDFDAQLTLLSQKGYHVVSLDDLDAALHHHAVLPPKPAIITFDDGFENQMLAFEILKKHNMNATFYIIDGGQQSKWCIGANRRPQNCGDAYLTWDQVRALDRSGLITIGSHTVDHTNLAAASEVEQRFEIFEGKSELEAQLGHVVKHFAYPYGTFTATTISLVEQAGFATAVSTQPGETQTLNTIYNLHRVREIRALP